MKRLISMLLVALPVLVSSTLAQAADITLRIAAPDLSAGTKSSGGPVSDVLHSRHLLEDALAAEGVRVEWKFFKGAGPMINEALSNGQLDAAFLGDLASIIGRAGGLQTRLIIATSRGNNGYLGVIPGSGIKNVQDLKGKRVAVLRGTADHLALIDVLKGAGMSERDVKVVNLDFNAANSALAARQIDASWAPARLFALKKKGLLEIPLSSSQLGGRGAFQSGLVVTQAFIDAHPQATLKLASTVAKALDWLSREENRQAQIELSAQLSAYPTDVLRESIEGADLRFIFSPLLDGYYVDTLRKDVQLAQEARLIRSSFDVEAWVAPEILNQALKDVGLSDAWQPATHYRWNTP